MTKPKAKLTKKAQAKIEATNAALDAGANQKRAAYKLLVIEVETDNAVAQRAVQEAFDVAARAFGEGRSLDTTITRDGSVARVSVQHR